MAMGQWRMAAGFAPDGAGIAVMKAVERFVVLLGRFGAWWAIPLVAFTIADVLLRRFFSIGSTALQEWEWHFHVLLFATALGYAYLRDVHVRIDLVRVKLAERSKAMLELLGILFLLLPFVAIVLFYGWTFVSMSYMQNEGSSAPGGIDHRWIIKTVLMAGLVVVVLAGLVVAARALAFLRGRAARWVHAADEEEAR